MKKMFFLGLLVIGMVIFGCKAKPALAYKIEDFRLPVENDFALGGGSIELWVNPGDKYTREITITNRLGKTMDFNVEVEDFKGSRNPEEWVLFLGNEIGPYTLKDYLKPEITKFTLNHGQRITLPIEVSIPKDAEPGGRYGAILVSTNPPESQRVEVEKEQAKGAVRIISRLSSLFFVRVKGDVKENGFFKELKIDKKFYEKGPIYFKLFFENKGNVHLTPHGIIEIRNLFGKKVDEIKVDPWFVLPDSLRLREVKWERPWLFGRYTALVSINRGYQDIVDQKSVVFWVIPWKIISAGLIALALIVWFFTWVASHFEIRRKRKMA
jgi:hypothetical protein